MADWSKLPYEMIHKVATCLEAIEDFEAFSAVCRFWRSVYLAKQWQPSPKVPCLILSSNENCSSRSFVSLYTNKVYDLELPEVCDRLCWGSSSGWLVTIGNDLKINLLNPFTRVSKSLPPASSLETNFRANIPDNWYQIIHKAFVINKPNANEDDLLVMVIYGPLKQLRFCRPGYSSWKCVKDAYFSRFVDVTYLNDRIFAVCDMGALFLVDIDFLKSPKALRVASPLTKWAWKELFLVEASGDLWLVHQYYNCAGNCLEFIAWSFDFNERRWIKLRDLGNHAIFLGDNCSSMSVSAPDRFNCKRNSVYFAVNKMEEGRFGPLRCDLGVYNMTDGVVEPLCSSLDIGKKYYSCPFWLIPALH